jgi:lipopolysaccharide assembly protein A
VGGGSTNAARRRHDVSPTGGAEVMVVRLLGWVAKAVLFALLVGFALKNSEMVTLRYFLGQEWSAPLSLVLLLFFGLGAVLGVVALLGLVSRQRREISQLRQAASGPSPEAQPSRQPDPELL